MQEEGFSGPGFRFARAFLLVILLLVGLMVTIAGFMTWNFDMDVTVKGKGVVEPRRRHFVKSQIGGIVEQIHVRQGQKVTRGQVLASIDDIHWHTELRKTQADLATNRSRALEVEARMRHEKKIRHAEIMQADVALGRARLESERVVAEHTILSAGSLWRRKPVEELIPVRIARAMVHQQKANLVRAQERLQVVEAQRQEIETLQRLHLKLEQDSTRIRHALKRSAVVAPVTGAVITRDLKYRQGDRIEAGETLLELAEDGEWQAAVMIRELDIPKIIVGQRARLFVDAFPHMDYKIFPGEVIEVSTTPAIEVGSSGVALYPVKISIQDAHVTYGGQIYSLSYGMSAEAKLVVDRGRVVELIWRKVMRLAEVVDHSDFRPPGQDYEHIPAAS